MGNIVFKIGDKVKTLDSSEVAVVRNVFPDGKVEIEYPDFGIKETHYSADLVPVSIKNVSVSPEEEPSEKEPFEKARTLEIQNFREEILLKVNWVKSDTITYEIINNSDYFFNLLIAKESRKNYIFPLKSFTLSPKASEIVLNFPFRDYAEYKKILAYVIKFENRSHHFIPAEIHRVKVNLPKLSLKNFSEKEVILPMKKEVFSSKENKEERSSNKEKVLPSELDLHAEKLLAPEDLKRYAPGDLLSLQLNKFRTFLEAHIVKGSEKCTVIHGIGKEVLKSEIHYILSKSNFVSKYEVIAKGGATIIYLK